MGFCGVLCGLFHYAAKKEIRNILSSFEGTMFGNKNLQQTTRNLYLFLKWCNLLYSFGLIQLCLHG